MPALSAGPVLGPIVGLVLMAALLVVPAAYLIPEPPAVGPTKPAWERTHAARLVRAVRLSGLSRDEKRVRSPAEYCGGAVFEFTQAWGSLLDERLLPQIKFWDGARPDHIAYLLPNTGRRPIPPPRDSLDTRPPIVVGYGLIPTDLKPAPLPLMPQFEQTGSIPLQEGQTVGQTFITMLDFDVLRAVGVLVASGEPAAFEGCELVLYAKPDKKTVLCRDAQPRLREHEAMNILWFTLDKAHGGARLKYNRVSAPYLFELTWRRPPGYAGPPPAFGLSDRDDYRGGELIIDGTRRPASDLAFTVVGTYTDVKGYARVLPAMTNDDEPEWPRLFFAVRLDLPQPERGEFVANYFRRLNESLLSP